MLLPNSDELDMKQSKANIDSDEWTMKQKLTFEDLQKLCLDSEMSKLEEFFGGCQVEQIVLRDQVAENAKKLAMSLGTLANEYQDQDKDETNRDKPMTDVTEQVKDKSHHEEEKVPKSNVRIKNESLESQLVNPVNETSSVQHIPYMPSPYVQNIRRIQKEA